MTASVSLPALLGGTPVRPEGPPSWPLPDTEVLAALEAAYRDGSWGKYHGVYVERLEARLAEYHGLPFALTCGSGTFAVELALRALKIGAGHEVILSAYDYPGNFLNIHAIGAKPVLVDVDPDNCNLAPSRLADAISPTTKAILVSHLHGGVVPMREVTTLASERGIAVIEDAAQMPGAVIQGRKAGTWGDIGILSFGGSKLLTAGRGGALVTRHADIHQRARTWLYRGNDLCPLSELQAAVLVPQLAKLDAQNAARTRNVAALMERLRAIPGIAPFRNHCEATEPGYYKLGMRLDYVRFGLLRERFLDAVRAEGIALDAGFNALHVGRSPNRFRRVGDLAEAERAHHQTVVLHHPVLLGSPADVEEVALAIGKIYASAERLAGAAQVR
jgi:perosamine synthetase